MENIIQTIRLGGQDYYLQDSQAIHLDTPIGEKGIGLGENVSAPGDNALAVGESTLAEGPNSFSQGSSIFRIGAEYATQAETGLFYAHPEGEYAQDPANVDTWVEPTIEELKLLVYTSDGRYCWLEDLRYTQAYGTGAMAAGQGAVAYSRSSKSLGYRTQTGYPLSAEQAAARPEAVTKKDENGFTIFPKDNTGQDAVAIGADTAATENQSFAGGWKCQSLSHAAFSFGTDNIVKGENSVGLGHGVQVNKPHSFGFGLNALDNIEQNGKIYRTIVDGNMSVAIASDSTTKGTYSAILGGQSNTTGESMHYSATVGGIGLTTAKEAQVVIGKYNEPDKDALFIIGNGSIEENKNALVINSDGSINGTKMFRTISAYPLEIEKGTVTIREITYPVLICNKEKTLLDGKKFVLVLENQTYEQMYSECNLTISGCHWDEQNNLTVISGGIDPKGCYVQIPQGKGAYGIRFILPTSFDLSTMKVAVYEVSEHNFLMTRRLRKMLNQGKVESTYFSVYENQWSNKKAISFGTSITRKQTKGTTKYLANSYADYLAQLFQLDLNNQGVGSSGVTVTSKESLNNLLRIKNFVESEDKDNYDLITLEVGANDIGYVWNGKGGSATDIYNPEDESGNTFCGRLNYCLKLLQEQTRAQIIVIPSPYSQSEIDSNETPPSWSTWDLIKQIYKTNNLTKECCAFNSVPCLMPETNLGFRRLDSDIKNEYVKNDISGSPDIHPTELGAQIIAENLAEKIKLIPVFYHE